MGWWKNSTVYQIYPRSFADGNHDGIGDIPGIIEKIPYLAELGVDVVWLSPVYRSPMDDNGYDISDYQDIHPEFGTMSDFDRMLSTMHQYGIRLVMDLVVNHSSDEHSWFTMAREGKDSPTRDYYIWRDPAPDGGPPNNWTSFFSGSAWELDQASGQYYLHLFSRKQPDLNWENPKLRERVYEMMRWWLDRGVDGFRMDVINLISKTPGLPDGAEGNGLLVGKEHYVNGPRFLEFMDEMNREVLSRYDTLTVGEMIDGTKDRALELTKSDLNRLNMIFTFEHVMVDYGPLGKYDPVDFDPGKLREVLYTWQKEVAAEGWNSLYLSNHDQPRHLSRYGNDQEYRKESAKLWAMVLHGLRGTPYVYQGEELGMRNYPFTSIEEFRDIEALNAYKAMLNDYGMSKQEALRRLLVHSRDHARTPMQWQPDMESAFPHPWIAVNPDVEEVNALQQVDDSNSVWSLYQRLIAHRKELPVLSGNWIAMNEDHPYAFVYARICNDQLLLVMANPENTGISLDVEVKSLPDEWQDIIARVNPRMLLSSVHDLRELPRAVEFSLAGIELKPWEACYLLWDKR
ncbi:alpha-glucosidase [Spirochaeta dissipatitropha]